MPRQYQDSIRGRDLTPQKPQRVGYQVKASPVQMYEAPAESNNATRLAKSLLQFNQNLAPWAEENMRKLKEQRTNEGALSRVKGEEQPKDAGEAFIDGYMSMDGAIKGNEDYNQLYQKYQTDFDKENGNIEDFVRQFHQEQTKGIDDPAFLKSYTQSMTNGTAKLLEEHGKYVRERNVEKVETNALDMLTQGVRSYVDNGMPIDDGYMDNIRQFLNKDMGVSNARFNDLMFAAVKRIGDEGNYTVYDVFKKSRPDGTPGMYNIPAWRDNIDAAQLHAMNIFLSKKDAADKALKKEREDRVDKTLLPVFMEPDLKKASTMYDQVIHQLVSNGDLDNASDAIKWRKNFEEYLDGKPSASQLDNEVALTTRVYSRSLTFKDILNADLTRSQRIHLLGELESAKRHDQTMAKENDNAVFKTPEFRMGEDYIKGMLASSSSINDPMGMGTPFEREQRSSAVLEYYRRAQGVQSPSELHAIREEIVTRYRKARKDLDLDKKTSAGAGRLRYQSAADLYKNAGSMSTAELRTQVEILKQQNEKAPK